MNLNPSLYRNGVFFFAALFLFALMAFWPRYLSQPLGKDVRFHLHAMAMTMWCLMLIAQAYLIRVGSRQLHRRLGTLSYVVAPAVALSTLILNHYRTRGTELDAYRMWILTTNVGDVLLFLTCFTLAMRSSRARVIHARYMICTGIVFIPAIFDRVFTFYVLSTAAQDMLPRLGHTPVTSLLSFATVGVILTGLAVWDWLGQQRVHVFAWMFCTFAVFYLVPFVLIRFPMWKSLLQWYLSMPLS